tara:strand:+ start:735 stop:1988 length:1254 start_codon:yes stop_codon:yes gene_type:complete
MDINKYLGVCPINKHKINKILDNIRTFYRISDINTYSCNVKLLTYNTKDKLLNHRHKLIKLIKKKYTISNTGSVCKALLSYKNKKYYKNIFIKEIPLLPVTFNPDITANLLSNRQSHNYFEQIYSTDSSPNIELYISYLTSKLFELNISPTFSKLYGYFYTIFKKFTYSVDDDTDNIKGVHYNDGSDNFIMKYEVPVLLLSIEKLDFDLDALDDLGKLTLEFYRSICFQIFMAIFTMFNTFGIKHNDLHIGNILFSVTKKEYIFYNLNNLFFKVPTFGFMVKIIDWGRGTYNYNNIIGKNNIFMPGRECENQIIFNRFNKRERLHYKWTDIVIFVQNLIFNKPILRKFPKFYTFLHKLIKTTNGIYISTKTFNWETYENISKNSFTIRPKNIVKHEEFRKYIIEKNPEKTHCYPIQL